MFAQFTRFPARAEQLEQLRTALADPRSGPVTVTGAPGAGRTSLLERLPEAVASGTDVVVPVQAAGSPEDLDRALTPDSPGRRILVLDDAHLAAHSVVRRLRREHRRSGAAVVVSRPDNVPEGALDCLRYEPRARRIHLPPLTAGELAAALVDTEGRPAPLALSAGIHATTGGNARLLAELLQSGALAFAAADAHVSGPPPAGAVPGGALSDAVRLGLAGALNCAWQELAFDQVDVLSSLTLALEPTTSAAAIRAFLMLLRGQPREGLALLDALERRVPGRGAGHEAGDEGSGGVVLVRAMLTGLGLGDMPAAAAFLRRQSASAGTPDLAARLLAQRAWLLAVAGASVDARQALREIPSCSDARAAVFAQAAEAALALGDSRPAAAIPPLRRALIGAQQFRQHLPWLPSLLTAYLIDASLLAGRLNEATSLAAGFHAAALGSGWDIAVHLSALIADPLRTRAARAQETLAAAGRA